MASCVACVGMADETVLQMRSVSKRYGIATAVEKINLDVRPHEAVALLGHNGAGKTTLARIAAGYLEPSEGTVTVAGRSPHNPRDVAVRSLISFISDVPALYDDLTVAEHIDLIALAYGVDDARSRRGELIVELGLERHADHLPAQLSRGLRQKTQLALGFVRPFSLMILDEPTAGLDPFAQQRLKELLTHHKEQGRSILFSTHDIGFARGVADRAVVLESGSITDQGLIEPTSQRWLASMG